MDQLPIILVTPPPVDDVIASDYLTSETTRQYAEKVQSVAERYNCLCLDLFETFGNKQACWTDDGVHLNTKGNELVYKGMMKLIQQKLPQLAPMTDGNGKYGDHGIPLEEKLWFELC